MEQVLEGGEIMELGPGGIGLFEEGHMIMKEVRGGGEGGLRKQGISGLREGSVWRHSNGTN